ncbi:MAG: T9SS type A sorting domain-containing protein [candidate division Zixibacteria bacterium]|nr:T9SS type A sorting domain-containing protein [candidate division Zixibacteria bacterium]
MGKLTESLISGTGVTIDTANNKVCFTPTATGCRTIIAKVTDACGAGDYDTISVCVNFNRPPFVIGPADTSVRICLGDTICRGPWIEGDLDHNIVLVQVPFGFIHGASICFVPDTSGTYSLIDCDVDSCGVKVCDTVKVTVDVNDPPNVTGPPDTTVWLCRVPASICVGPFGFSDPDHNIKTKSVNKGTLANDTVCYTATTGAPDTIIVTVIDSCGVVDKDTVIVTKTLNQPPVCNFLPVAPSICANAEFILPFTDVDPEGGATSCVLYGPGILSGNLYRYTPLGGETIHVIIRCKDACGDSCSIEFTTTFKSKQPPVCILPRDTTIFQCAPSQACLPVTATSLNPPVICKVVGGPGAVTNGNWCYTPTGEQSVDVTIRCTDACSTSCEGTFHVAFDMNDPPLIVLGNDTSVTLCNPPVPVCVGYSVSDPNGPRKLTESLFSGPAGASIDTVANKICFTPTVTGNYTIIAKVTDSCGAFDLDTIVVTVIPAVPPVCYLPTDQTYNRCAPAQVCLAVSATGDHKPTCALISGPGALAQGAWCYTPSGVDTSFTVTIRCTDTCGAFCEGSFHVTYKFNKLAQINFGRDTSVFQCTLTPICVPYTVTDPDGLAGIIETLVSGPPSATIDTAGNKICFTPTASGSYTIIAREEEPCYFVDYDTIVVTVTLNSPPVIDLGVDKTVFLCATAPICVPYTVSDPNGLGKLGEHLLSGPAGTAIDTAGNKVCFTPGTSGNFTIVVIVTDACGAFDMDTAVVHVTYNGPPTIDFGSDQSVTLCTPSQICAPYVVSDPNGPGKLTDMLLSGPPAAFLDTLNRRVCFTPGSSGTYTIIAKVTDSCGSEDRDTVVYTVTLNSPPKIVLGPDQTVQQCTPAQICVTYTVSDPNGFSKLTESLASGPAGATIDTAANMICFTPTGTGFFTIMANVTDSCQFTDADTVVIIVVPGQDCECRIRVSINGGTQLDVLNGETVTVPILIDHTNALLGGYDFLLCFDPTGVNFVTAQKGSVIPNWEYFTYRLGTRGDCGIGCPSGLIRIIGIADMNNGSSHPPAEEFLPDGVIATIKFLVTTDRNFIGQCLPIRFCWLDCGDNTISDKTGDTTFIGVGVRYDTCQSQAKVNPISAICFTDGQICIQEPPDDRGDVNLNGIANEVGDAVLYTNYFIYGDKVWNPVYKAAQLLASDVNDDGIVLTVADLIFLIRIITGDQQPLLPGGNPKILALDPAHVVATVADGALQLGWQSDVAVGGAHFVIDVPSDAEIGTPALTPDVADMEIRSNLEGNQLRVLVYSRTARQIPAGRHTVVTIPMTNAARASVSTYDLSTGDGEVLPATLAHGAPLPTGFNLQQNYPNPFNAGTVIRFGLDQPGPYSVSIYDITGRRIWYSEGETAGGWVEVRWDGRNDNGVQLASGIYLYRVQTQQGIQIKKMTLLK